MRTLNAARRPGTLLASSLGLRSAAAVERLAAAACFDTFEAGTTIWDAGDPARGLHVISRGLVKITRSLPSGSDRAFAILGPRDCAGLLALVDGVPYPAKASAMSDEVEILTVRVDAALDVLSTDPALARALLNRLASNARQLLAKISVVSSGPVPARIATVLLHLAERYGDESSDGALCVPIRLTRRTIGELAETRVETVIRVLSGWREAEMVQTNSLGFEIRDAEELRRIAADG